MYFGKRPALSPVIVEHLEADLAQMKVDKLKVEVPKVQFAKNRKFDFERAAQFFVDHLPTNVEMQNYMGVTKMSVYKNVRRPEFINAVRSLGYDGEISLRDGRLKKDRFLASKML